MNRRGVFHRSSLIGFLFLLQAATLSAQNTRSWVASFGLDTNDCTRPAPCRTFGRAIAVSNPGAEIVVMDSAGYGPVSITKPIQIISPQGVHAALAPTTGTAINIVTTGGTVVLRNLFVNSQGASIGINASTPGTVLIEGCTVSGFTFSGIFAGMPDLASLVVRDSVVRDNGTYGIRFEASSGTAMATVENTLIADNGDIGLSAFTNASNVRAVARHVTSVGNNYQFFAATSPTSGATAQLDIESCSAIGTSSIDIGVRSFAATGATTTVRVSSSTITGNHTGVSIGGTGTSNVLGRLNNTLEGNTFGNAFSGTYTAK